MSQPALQRLGAELEQAAESFEALGARAHESDAGDEADASTREARKLAELAGSFCLFGLRIDQFAWTGESWDGSAEAAYRTDETPSPANDAAPSLDRAFPELTRRGLHVEPRYAIRLIQALDWIIVALAAQFAALWGAGVGLAELPLGQALAFVLGALGLKAGLWLTETYRVTPRRIRPERGIGGLALGAIIGLVVAHVLAPDARSAAAHRRGVFSETIVLVGATEAAERLVTRAAKSGEARVVAVVDDRLSRAPGALAATPVGGNLDDLLAWEGLPHVDRIVITVTQKAETRVRDIIERLRAIPNRVDLLLDYDTQSVRGGNVARLGGAAVACVSGRPHSARRAMIKRAEDLIVSAGLFVLFALPMLAIAIAVKLDSKGPVLFRQRRHGFNNRVITVLKFRTMRHEPGAPLRQVCANDPRVTRIGAFLRRTSLDELPQLINVLRGEMSLVGPRPHAIGMKAAERDLEHIVAEYAHRHRVKPGITGWAQVNGSRGPIETPAAVRRRLKLDLDYVSRASLWLDLQILMRTAPVLFGDTKTAR
ncbi:MAG: exopolysaccharide biosynthesis polyprenyl glycosylphosphotransferase [Phycisphaerales bacterium]|nr:exopolysaccharide biosynthesis polyprenyl glycosylphosphotransferase [Hyphomonadaceae bacterium]